MRPVQESEGDECSGGGRTSAACRCPIGLEDAGESQRPRRPPSRPRGGHALRQEIEDPRHRSPGLVGELNKFTAASWNTCTLSGPCGVPVRDRRCTDPIQWGSSSWPQPDAERR
jgi:hypothetical protein